jgi:hypothetical protein
MDVSKMVREALTAAGNEPNQFASAITALGQEKVRAKKE